MVEAFEINKLKTSFSELNFEKLEQFNKLLFKNYLENSPTVLLKEMSEHLTEKFGHVPVSDKVLLKIVELERINKVSDLTTNPDLQFIWQRSKICAFFLALSLSDVSFSSCQRNLIKTNGNDFFMSLVKWPKIAVKKSHFF